MAQSSGKDDLENVAQGNAPGDSGRKAGIVGLVLILFMLLGLVNLGSHWFGPMFSESGLIGQFISNPGHTSVNSRLRSDMWPSFRSEASTYVQRDLLLTDLALKKYLSMREKLRNAAPMVDYVMVRALRFLGFFSYFLGGLIVVGLFIIEGLKKNAEKRLNFKQFSSTKYHLVLKTGVVGLSGLFTFYLFVPNEIYIPFLFQMDVPSLLYSPLIWAAFITVGMSYTAFVITSNLSTKV